MTRRELSADPIALLSAVLAEKHGLTLCDHCQMPREMHAGFDHGQNKCLLQFEVFAITRHMYGNDVVDRLRAYFEDLDRESLAELNKGAGI